jgi:hypothetical protein
MAIIQNSELTSTTIFVDDWNLKVEWSVRERTKGGELRLLSFRS